MEKKIDKFCFILCIIIYGIGILLQLIFSFSQELWVDETFTLNLIDHTYKEIINITAIDVHPPLYYLILKFFISVIRLIFNNISVIIVSKSFSIIPYIILPIILYNKLKKHYEKYSIGLFLLSTIYIVSYGVEIRMYSWAMFFVVLAFIYFYQIINDAKISDWILFVISGVLAAYTHYFAGASIICLYILLLIWGITKNKKILKNWIISVIVSIIVYLPWLIIFVKQVMQVKEEYWIEEILFGTIVVYIDFLFSNNNYLYYSAIIASILLIKCIIIDKKFDNKVFYSISGLMTLIGTVIIGIVASKIIRPVFVSRYMFPAIPCFYIGISSIIYILNKKSLKYIFAGVLMVSCIWNFMIFANTESELLNDYNQIIKVFSNNESKIFITDESHVQRIMAVVIPNSEAYVYNDVTTDLSLMLYKNIGSIYTIDEIKNIIKSREKVYFVQSDYLSEIEKIFDENDIKYEYVGEYFCEYRLRIYELKK